MVTQDPVVDVPELSVAVRMLTTLVFFPIGLEAVAGLVQEVVHEPLADRVAQRLQFVRQVAHALAGPTQALRSPGTSLAA
jgi:hypothetical protein